MRAYNYAIAAIGVFNSFVIPVIDYFICRLIVAALFLLQGHHLYRIFIAERKQTFYYLAFSDK